MEQTLAAGAEVFPHIRIVMGMVIGLGVARLLSGVARIVQYLIRTPLLVGLCIVAALTTNRWFHRAFVVFTLIYQASWILRLFDTIA